MYRDFLYIVIINKLPFFFHQNNNNSLLKLMIKTINLLHSFFGNQFQSKALWNKSKIQASFLHDHKYLLYRLIEVSLQ